MKADLRMAFNTWALCRSLEETFDVELFLRSGNTTKLTEAGETLLGLPERCLDANRGDRPPPKWGADRRTEVADRCSEPECDHADGQPAQGPPSQFRLFPHH